MPEESTVVTEPRENANAKDSEMAKEINDLVTGAINDAAAAGKFEDLALCHATRRMLWEKQTVDGRLPKLNKLPKDRKVFTWEGAPDVGVPYADELIVEHKLVRNAVRYRGEIRLGPRETEDADGTGDEDKASAWQTALDFYLDVSRKSFDYQQSLFNVCVDEYGYAGLFVGARRRVRKVKRTVKVTQLLGILVQQSTEQVEKMMEAMGGWNDEARMTNDEGIQHPASSIEDPESSVQPEIAAQIQSTAQETLEMLLTPEGQAALEALLLEFDPGMPASEARIAARELRTTALEATYYATQDDGFWPYTQALVPFINWIHGSDLSGEGKTWWGALPEILCEADVRVRAAVEKWQPKFLEAVLSHANQFLISDQTWEGRVPRWACNGAGVGLALASMGSSSSQQEKFFQVVYVWRELPNRKGEPMVYHTLVHPKVNDCVGFHECSELETLPFHVETQEEVLYAWQSRGLPQIVVKAGQNLIKDLLDADGAGCQLRSNPPLNRTADAHVEIEPGQQMFVHRNQVNSFLQVPASDPGTATMMDRVRDMLDRRFFRHEKTDPDMKRLYRESLALQAAASVREVIVLIWKVLQGKVTSMKASRIAGRVVNLDVERDSMQGEVDVTVECHVDGLSNDAADRLAKFGTDLLAMGGDNIDRNELGSQLAHIINPRLARRIILNSEVAAKRIADDQNNRIAQMAAGVPMSYDERASSPQMRLNVMQAWLEQPGNVERARQDQAWAEKMQDEVTFLQRQIQQYQENAVTGRTLMPAEAGAR